MKEYKENKFARPLNKNRVPYWIFAIYGALSLFLFFLPFIYTLNNNTPVWVSGFDMLVFMEDSASLLHYGVVFLLLGYILGGLLLPTGLFGMFGEEKILKTPLSLGLGLTVLKVGCEIAGMILLAQCKEMHIYLEFGSYISVLSSGIVLIGQIILLGLSKSKRKD
ncbi:MAG: hypothetical protein K5762_06000 [Bacilli bacterium]|nr:hypothetical protein [Bacilli bacterium]